MLEWQDQIDLGALRACLASLLSQHDMLRAVYEHTAAGLVQTVTADIHTEPQIVLLPAGESGQKILLETANDIQSGIDLQAGPMIKAVVFRDAGGLEKDRLLLVIHH